VISDNMSRGNVYFDYFCNKKKTPTYLLDGSIRFNCSKNIYIKNKIVVK
jgi:hypothetical protein